MITKLNMSLELQLFFSVTSGRKLHTCRFAKLQITCTVGLLDNVLLKLASVELILNCGNDMISRQVPKTSQEHFADG